MWIEKEVPEEISQIYKLAESINKNGLRVEINNDGINIGVDFFIEGQWLSTSNGETYRVWEATKEEKIKRLKEDLAHFKGRVEYFEVELKELENE